MYLVVVEKCVHAMEEIYLDWIIAQTMSEQFKDDMKMIVIMPQGLKKMSTPKMWPKIEKGDFWPIGGQHNV